MYTEEQIKNLFGDSTVQYIKNKNTGGVSNSKGNTYENIFAIYKISLLSKCVLECNKEIYLLSQCLSFIDDLIIELVSENSLQHYQLKNSSAVTWGTGEKSINDDFKKQYELNKSISKASELALVVSSSEIRDKLQTNIPNDIKNYSQVIYFYFADSLPKIIAQEPDFRRSLEYLCAFDNPDPDKIECLATVLLGAWEAINKSKVSLMDILKKAQHCIPSYIRSFQAELQLDPEVIDIFDKIDSFTYNLTRGFLKWEYFDGLNEGTISYSIETTRFQKFQELIKKHHPTSFEELEVFLI
ncbi:hypothetical protein H6G54_23485 [Anabaena cylindrica FACHB-243]|uniref:Uncharacterized protein n=1 Tax=Anabaena cylindrica (strain ATCC 27899 / PCC 7122) TaxID=272123 RepID=K9ZKF5_ANACC|nr:MULTISPECIES: hypothetical protein [Anabaena]AFZ59047.1 hypothetical protein Anacy_3657 [Anabaena cylindrica PCC 7122]MBD2420613.1 hypothetical protein [Anabaena cylindrica FACHB-243]MBY5282365.1 hypothetical protein [Anabaena sp. CCAP 1446/1C]MBY5309224.1 hypothetical protein [Anabaena sp. CCAP 1446/1C]MCM2408572.1 hypothetical protein [Anabaena sp. CCAP 1446/1C]